MVFEVTVRCEQKGKPTDEKKQHFVLFFGQILEIVMNFSPAPSLSLLDIN